MAFAGINSAINQVKDEKTKEVLKSKLSVIQDISNLYLDDIENNKEQLKEYFLDNWNEILAKDIEFSSSFVKDENLKYLLEEVSKILEDFDNEEESVNLVSELRKSKQ